MIVVVNAPGDNFLPSELFEKIGKDVHFFSYDASGNRAILELKPSLVILTHPLAAAQAQTLRNGCDGNYMRILVINRPEANANNFKCMLSGADGCIVLPKSNGQLRHILRCNFSYARRCEEAAQLLGQTIADRFKLQRILGISLRSAVFAANDAMTNQTVSVKMLRRKLLETPEVVAAFFAKVEKMRTICCQELPEILDCGTFADLPYVIYNIGTAENLYRRASCGNIDEKELLKIGLTVTRALLKLKHGKVLHLNIKPENILYSGGQYYLAEFGLPIPCVSPLDDTAFPFWSGAAYAGPEFFLPETVLTARSDVYSLGVLLYTLAMRSNPYAGVAAEVLAEEFSGNSELTFPPDTTQFSKMFQIIVEGMTVHRVAVRPRLRDLELMFYQLSAILNGRYPDIPLGESRVFVEMPELPGKMQMKTVSHSKLESDTAGIERLINTPATPPPEQAEKNYFRRYWLGVLRNAMPDMPRHYSYCAGGGVLAILMLSVWLFCDSSAESAPQGRRKMYGCYSNHFFSGRTLNLRDIRCPQCGDNATEAYRCTICQRKFAETIWPLRAMTEAECVEFEKKIARCPYCKSQAVRPLELPPATEVKPSASGR